MIISKVAIQRTATVWAFVIMIVLFGAFAYYTLPREAAPDVEIPFVFVTTTYEGVAPEDMESGITVILEKKLKGISDVKEITSQSREGVSMISVEFEPTLEIEDALQKVRDKIDQAKPDLPDAADEPFITELNIAEFPIMFINVSGDVGLVRLKSIADDLKDRIEAVNGVLKAEVIGGLEREVRIEFDPDRLASYQIPLPDLLSLVAEENANVSGGRVDIADSRYQIRVPAEFEDPLEIMSLSLKPNGAEQIYLTDVASIIDTHKDVESYARFNGEETVTVSVQKRVGENIVEIADEIKQILAEENEGFPAGVTATVTLDQSQFIRDTVSDLENNIMTALILVVGVIFFFMGGRNAVFVALAVPLSMLITFATLQMIGVTLNMVVLFSLILALGMLVDNAIVIVENIYRHMQQGANRKDASLTGSSEVAWPIITSTFTTVAAFTPLLFWPGLMGEFMAYLPMTVIIVLLASLLVAMAVNPTICSKFMRVFPKRSSDEDNPKKANPIIRGYAAILHLALRHPFPAIVLPILCLALVIAGYISSDLGTELFPDVEPRSAQVLIKAPEGTNIEATNEMALQIEEVIKELPDIKYCVANVGSGGGGGFGFDSAGPNLATVSIEFVDRRDRSQKSNLTIDQLREKLKSFLGADIQVKEEEHGPPVGAPISVEISGENFDVLSRLSRDVKQVILQVPGIVDLRDDFVAARPELQFHVDRDRATLLGLSTRYIGDFVTMAVQGREVDTFWEGNEEYDITLRLAEPFRSDPVKIGQLLIPDRNGNQIPLSSVAQFEFGGGLGAISRIDQDRVITITSNVSEGFQSHRVLQEVREHLDNFPLPRGYEISYSGENEDTEEAQAFLAKAFVAAVMLVLLILVSQFNSFSVPIIVMFTVILSITGVLLGLTVTRTPFGIIMTGIGVISLAGVVVNNGIVLTDYIEKLLRRGQDIETALVNAGKTRLRPVMLTAITTILGLMPMAIGMSIDFKAIPAHLSTLFGSEVAVHRPILDFASENAQWWGPMAVAVVFGLAFATILTLVVVPTLYYLFYRLRKRFGTEVKATPSKAV